MDDIFRYVNADRMDDAEALCRRALQGRPGDVNVLGMLGAILLKKKQHEEAEVFLKRTIELEPAFAKPHEDLGLLYLDRGDAEQALACLEKAIVLDESLLSARRGVAVALQRLGRNDEAEAARARFMTLSPAAQSLAEADKLRKAGDTERAEQICQELITREPDNIAALRLLAVIAAEDGRSVIAEGLLRRILKLSPDNVAVLGDLGRFLGDNSRYPEAIELLEQAVVIDASYSDVQVVLGDMLGIVGRYTDALAAYEKSLERSPDDPVALIGRGHMLRIGGGRDEAIESYRRALEIHPENGDAWWNLASLHGYQISDDEVTTMRATVDAGDLSPESAVSFRFALARACEQREDYAGAWEQYTLGNSGKRTLVKYDPVETEVLHGKLRDALTSDIFDKDRATTPENRTPVFILGMPRSGSTLIEQILASHSMVEGVGELPYIIMMSKALGAKSTDKVRYPEIMETLDASQLTGLGRSYLHYTHTHCASDAPYFTDKMPANYSHVGLIHLILPNAKIIDARRNPIGTSVANYRTLFARGKNQTYDLTELAEHYLQYVEMMDHWDDVLPGKILHVQYEDVVADLGQEVRRILEFCDLPFEEACINYHQSARPVNTASSEQVRQPIYDSAVDFWKNYESHLDELKEILQPVL